MRVVVSTSNLYKHIIPVFLYLYTKYWNDPATIIGYEHPGCELQEHITFHSMGVQGNKTDFSKDMHAFFSTINEPVVWLCEDTLIKSLNRKYYDICRVLSMSNNVGRVSLTNNSYKFYTEFISVAGQPVVKTPSDSDYRLSMQPAIWNPRYLLKHLRPGFTPWSFENQDGTLMTFHEKEFINIALQKYDCPLDSNEGVRKHDIHKYDLTGIAQEDIDYLKSNRLI